MRTEIYFVYLRVQSKYGKIRTRKTPNTDTFYAVALQFLKKIMKIRIDSFQEQSSACKLLE